VLGLGLLLIGGSGLGYLIYQPVFLFVLRGVHGVGWAAFNTGGAVLAAAIAPAARRGEALGYIAATQNLAMAVLPATALGLLGLMGFGGVFGLIAATGLLGVVVVLLIPRQRSAVGRGGPLGFWEGLVERGAVLPLALQSLSMLAYPALSIFIALYAVERQIAVDSLILYFLASGAATVVAVNIGGRLSDRFGPGWVIAGGAVATATGLLLIAIASNIIVLTLGGVVAGFGMSASSPSMMALAIDRSHPDRRGAALATYSMAFQIGQGGGAALSGLLTSTVGWAAMYALTALPAAGILVLVAANWHATVRPTGPTGG
jgi:predicted MFS family arabinose efflux permease